MLVCQCRWIHEPDIRFGIRQESATTSPARERGSSEGLSTIRRRGKPVCREGVQTVVVGDIRDIRQNLDYGRKANQKLHQMVSGRMRWFISYKAQRLRMVVELQNEAYTSQECPVCGRRHKPSGRRYVCACGFRYHRDGVGGFNIRKKYLGSGPVVGDMAPPTGMRYAPHARVALDETLFREAAGF